MLPINWVLQLLPSKYCTLNCTVNWYILGLVTHTRRLHFLAKILKIFFSFNSFHWILKIYFLSTNIWKLDIFLTILYSAFLTAYSLQCFLWFVSQKIKQGQNPLQMMVFRFCDVIQSIGDDVIGIFHLVFFWSSQPQKLQRIRSEKKAKMFRTEKAYCKTLPCLQQPR